MNAHPGPDAAHGSPPPHGGRSAAAPDEGRTTRGWRAEARAVLLFAAFSVLWTWPLARDPAGSTVALHFDVYPAAWLAQAAPTFLWDGTTALTGFPDGEALARMDSYLFLALSAALGGAVPGLLLCNLLVLLGPVASAWGAWRFARVALGASFPASVAAGLAFGFGPLALVAALEGHVYVLLDPWLPLCALAVWQGRAGAAVLHFALALLTSAYLGVDALLLVGAVAWARPEARVHLARVTAGVGAVGAAYAVFYLSGSSGPPPEGDPLVRIGVSTWTTLVAWTPWMDLSRHSLAPVLGVAPLAVAAVAGRTLRSRSARRLVVVGALAAVGTLGPVVEAGVAREGGLPGPLWPLLPLGVFDVWRFPVRLGWISALCFGAAAAALASAVPAAWRARAGWTLVALVCVDALWVSGAWWRVRGHPAPSPSVYALLPDGPVLELFPEVGGAQEDLPFYTQKLPCLYQTLHGRPIYERCVTTDRRGSPRQALARTLHARLLADAAPAEVSAVLAGSGAGSVVVHADLYQPFERAEVVRGLSAAYGTPIEGRDGGEHLLAWRVR